MIDVVVREDDPVDPAHGLLRGKSNDGAEAAGIAGVDDGNTVVAPVQVGLRAPNARNSTDHAPIIDPTIPSPARGGGTGWGPPSYFRMSGRKRSMARPHRRSSAPSSSGIDRRGAPPVAGRTTTAADTAMVPVMLSWIRHW